MRMNVGTTRKAGKILMERNRMEIDTPTRVEALAKSMKSWLVFLGGAFTLLALPYAFTGQGLLVAWVPVWLGVLLIQAGKAAGRMEIERMLRKIKSFVVVLGVTFAVMLVGSMLAVALAGYPPFARWIEWTGF